MKKLLNTLYIQTPESYLFLRNDNICVKIGDAEKVAVPALTVESVVCFGVATVSTPLIGFCSERGISLTFLNTRGRFLGSVHGVTSGNVLLRKRQYETVNEEPFRVRFVRDLLYAKLRNSKDVLMRHARSTKLAESAEALYGAAKHLSEMAQTLAQYEDVDSMRGVEGAAASVYFAQFDKMLHGNPNGFSFETRSRRPPRNEVNGVLSFVYTLMATEMKSALETVGLDPAAGYLHTLRPGRASFALDLLEELRSPLCDRFVLSLFNKGQLSKKDFETDEEAVFLNEKGRKTVLVEWQRRKADTVTHPFLGEKISVGLIPYVQAMLFARCLRGDLDRYPPFVWR